MVAYPSLREGNHVKGRISSPGKEAAGFLAPSLVTIGFIIIYPLIRSLWLSVYNYKYTRPDAIEFVGLGNYIKMFSESIFQQALVNTLIFTSITVVISLLLGLIIAVVIDTLSMKFSGIRGFILIPWVVPGIVVGYLFMYMFDVEVGIVNFVLQKLRLIDTYLPWLMDHNLAMAAIIIAHIWNQTPFYVLMITASLKSIPEDIKEAAYAEGTSRWQDFIYITLPYVRKILVISSLLMIIRNFNNFPIIFTMTGGGPVYATTTSVIYIYRLAFEQYNMGYASAIGIFWVIVMLILSYFYVKALQKEF